jgi:hypothetical protein
MRSGLLRSASFQCCSANYTATYSFEIYAETRPPRGAARAAARWSEQQRKHRKGRLPKSAASIWGAPILPTQIEVRFVGRQRAMVHGSLWVLASGLEERQKARVMDRVMK